MFGAYKPTSPLAVEKGFKMKRFLGKSMTRKGYFGVNGSFLRI